MPRGDISALHVSLRCEQQTASIVVWESCVEMGISSRSIDDEIPAGEESLPDTTYEEVKTSARLTDEMSVKELTDEASVKKTLPDRTYEARTSDRSIDGVFMQAVVAFGLPVLLQVSLSCREAPLRLAEEPCDALLRAGESARSS